MFEKKLVTVAPASIHHVPCIAALLLQPRRMPSDPAPVPIAVPHEALQQHVRSEIAKWAKVVKVSGAVIN